jgi:hypothetical protein
VSKRQTRRSLRPVSIRGFAGDREGGFLGPSTLIEAGEVPRQLVLLSQSVAAFVDRNHIFEKTHFSAWGG